MTSHEVALLSNLSEEAQAVFRRNLRHLDKLVTKRISFPAFLDAYLRCVTDMYAATAAAIWVRGKDRDDLQLRAQINYAALGLEGQWRQAHDDLLRFALRQSPPQPFLVKPYSAPTAEAGVSNPTDSFVVFGPVDNQGDVVAMVELFLGPRPARAQTTRDQESYVLLLKRLIWYLCRRVECELDRGATPEKALLQAATQMTSCRQEIVLHQVAIRNTVEGTLRGLAGLTCGSFEANRALAQSVQELLAENGLRLVCSECGQPAILRCQRAGNSKSGAFQYDHTVAGRRTFHGGSTSFPLVAVVPAPPRRSRGKAGQA